MYKARAGGDARSGRPHEKRSVCFWSRALRLDPIPARRRGADTGPLALRTEPARAGQSLAVAADMANEIPVTVSHWMKRPSHTVKPQDSIRHARAILEEHRINQLPVTTDGRLVGIVTDRDLRDAFPSVLDHRRSRPARSNPSPDETTVELVMTGSVLTVCSDDTIAEAARVMRKGRIGALPVIDGAKLVGIITRSDLLDALAALIGGTQAVSKSGQ
jgi:CBS domain-containing protein